MSSFGQVDFSAGMVRAVARDLIPENGAYDIRDMLLDDDGNVYLRGPTARASTSAFAGSALTSVWELNTIAGRRTLFANSAGLGVLDGAGAPVAISLAGGAFPPPTSAPVSQIGDLSILPVIGVAASKLPMAYAGSRKANAYSTGTLTKTNGSDILTGAGTSWLANVDAGMIWADGASAGAADYYVVKSVDTNTQITLNRKYQGATAAVVGYSLAPVAGIGPEPAPLVVPFTVATCSTVVGDKLFVAEGARVYVSQGRHPTNFAPQPGRFTKETDYHEFPGAVIALAALRDRLVVFTAAGIWLVSNTALEIVDDFGNPQHRLDRISGDVIARSVSSFTTWRDSLIVAAGDGVYALDVTGQLELVSRAIGPLWQAHTAAGHTPGLMAVFRDHLFLPVGGEVLVARLDRRVSTPVGKTAPWTRLTGGEAGAATSFAVKDPLGSAKLYAGASTTGYVLDFTGLFVGDVLPATATAADADGSAYGLYLETRDFVPSGNTPAYVDKLLLSYESTGGTISLQVSKGRRATPGAARTFEALATAPGGNYSTQDPRAVAVRKTSRRVAFSFGTGGLCAGARIRGFSVTMRERGLQR